MAYIIRDRGTPPKFYTGSGWSDQENQAQEYHNVGDATRVIQQHGMAAQTVERARQEQPQNGGAPETVTPPENPPAGT